VSLMRVLRAAALVCAISLPLIAVAGCASIVPPDVSGLMKIATGRMNNLTGEEVLALASSSVVAAYAPNIQLTDAQADAIAEFLADNNIATLADLQALLQQAHEDPGSVVLPDGFFELFADFELPEQQA
jgi:hypothetical protein